VAITDPAGSPVNSTVEGEDGKPLAGAAFKANVAYTPKVPGEHKVKVTYGGKHIKGSPFTTAVAPELTPSAIKSLKVLFNEPENANAGSPLDFGLLVLDKDLKPVPGLGPFLSVSARPPNKKDEPLPGDVKRSGFGYDVGMTPKTEGPHEIDVSLFGTPAHDKPFILNVSPSLNPKPLAKPIKEAEMCIGTRLLIDTGLSTAVSLDSVSSQVICEEASEEIDSVITPQGPNFYVEWISSPGNHSINLLVNGVPVKGCPFVYNVPKFEQDESILAQGVRIFSFFGKKK